MSKVSNGVTTISIGWLRWPSLGMKLLLIKLPSKGLNAQTLSPSEFGINKTSSAYTVEMTEVIERAAKVEQQKKFIVKNYTAQRQEYEKSQ
jgi:hypothetical protein